jgi:hypothetical protein
VASSSPVLTKLGGSCFLHILLSAASEDEKEQVAAQTIMSGAGLTAQYQPIKKVSPTSLLY